MKSFKQGHCVRILAIVFMTVMLGMLCNSCSMPHAKGLEFRKKGPIVLTGLRVLKLKPEGTVISVGENKYGQGNVSEWRDIVSIAASDYHTVGLKPNGTVVAVGINSDGLCNVSDWRDIVDIAASDFYTIGVKSDGTVLITGATDTFPIDAVLAWRDIVSVRVDAYQIAGLKSDGTVVTANPGGRNIEAPDWTDIVGIAVSQTHLLGLKSDGTVVAVGDNEYGECNVSEWRDIIAISTSAVGTVGLKSDGTVNACGQVISSHSGKPGPNVIILKTVSERIGELKDITAVSTIMARLVVLNKDNQIEIIGDKIFPSFTKEDMEKLQE